MYSKILVAVDGSEPSRSAIQHAAALAADQKAAVRLLHVVELGTRSSLEGAASIDAFANRAALEAERVLREAEAVFQAAGVTPESRIVGDTGSRQQIGDVVASDARQWGADLIVMGTQGRRGVRSLLVGSVAQSVVRQAEIPVLLLRRP